MSTQKQIDANRQNAQASSGPVTEAGLKRSSLNATRHGLTGQTLVLSPAEEAPYAQFVKDYFADWQPYDVITRQLTQQLADAHWSIHQIFVQQSNLLSMINAATAQLNQETDAITAATTVAKLSKTLSTYSIYETRRRRFADAIELKLITLVNDHAERIKKEIPEAAKIAKTLKANGKPFNPVDFGFVCSAEDVEQFLKGQDLARSCQKPPTMTLADLEAQNWPSNK
jgi:DNA-binding protein